MPVLQCNESMSKTPKKSSKTRRWSAQVTKRSDALDLESDVFKGKDPHRIALSLKRSAERSKERKGTTFQSAMSMLNFYINRAGKILPASKKKVLERAKAELRKLFHKEKKSARLRLSRVRIFIRLCRNIFFRLHRRFSH